MLRENSTQESAIKETVHGIFQHEKIYAEIPHLSWTPGSHLQFEPALLRVLALFSVNPLVKTAALCMSTVNLPHAVLGHTKGLYVY